MLRALDLAEAIASGDLTPSGVLELAAEAIAARDGEVQAFTHLDLDKATLTARDPALAATALAGLPVGVKDIIDTADMPTGYGTKIYDGWQPRADATVVSMLRRAGGNILGKTVTTELAYLEPGKTANPHNAMYSPGGSSSGSAAGVAAGMLALALGTQTGGSVIRPANYCGVAAIKPSFRLLPSVGAKHFAWTLDTIGLFGARVVDVAFGLASITGRPLRVDGRDFGTPRFGIMRQPYAGTPEPDSIEAMDVAAAALRRAGATVNELVEPAAFAVAHAAHAVVNDYEGALALSWERQTHPEALSALLTKVLDTGAGYQPHEYDEARREARAGRRALTEAFANYDVLLAYSAAGAAPMRDNTGSATFNRLITLLGIPAVHVPVTTVSDNRPIGIQVLAPFGRDAEALAAAAFLEGQLGRS